MTAFAHRFPTPLGEVLAVHDDRKRLTRLDFTEGRDLDRLVSADTRWTDRGFGAVMRQLGEYLEGRRRAFDLELAPEGSPFQHEVWRALGEIPFGETRTYGELADALGRPGAARAVGRANATNPIAVVVPCHRVIGTDRTLTGYAGGLPRKRALLELEGLTIEGSIRARVSS